MSESEPEYLISILYAALDAGENSGEAECEETGRQIQWTDLADLKRKISLLHAEILG